MFIYIHRYIYTDTQRRFSLLFECSILTYSNIKFCAKFQIFLIVFFNDIRAYMCIWTPWSPFLLIRDVSFFPVKPSPKYLSSTLHFNFTAGSIIKTCANFHSFVLISLCNIHEYMLKFCEFPFFPLVRFVFFKSLCSCIWKIKCHWVLKKIQFNVLVRFSILLLFQAFLSPIYCAECSHIWQFVQFCRL